MKKTATALGFAMITLFTYAQEQQTTPTPQENPNAPEMTFEAEEIDYGTIEHNADGVRYFKFTNTGKEPLIITSAKGSCGCTVPTYPKEPIAPGASGEIKVKYATNRVGAFSKTVTITSNAKTQTKVLKIKGTVKPEPAKQEGTPLQKPQDGVTPVASPGSGH